MIEKYNDWRRRGERLLMSIWVILTPRKRNNRKKGGKIVPPLEIFLWGFCGSAAVEVVNLYIYFNKDDNTLPSRYRRTGFWIIRVLLAIIAGGLALAYNIENPILAINIGAATPLIVQTLTKSIPDV